MQEFMPSWGADTYILKNAKKKKLKIKSPPEGVGGFLFEYIWKEMSL